MIISLHNKNLKFLKFSPTPLAVFAFGDVMLFNSEIPFIQLFFAVLSYCFIFLSFCKHYRDGILYLFSFNILSIGVGNYWDADGAIFSYWGLRCGPFSFNIIFSGLLTFILCVKSKSKHLFPSDLYTKFFLLFILWCFIVGLLTTLLGYNYIDNFKSDLLMFLPIIFYIILARKLSLDEFNLLIKYIIPLTVYSLIIAYIFEKKASYSQETFLIGNAFACIAPIGVIILRKYFKFQEQVLYLLVYLVLISTMSILIGGKLIISYIALLIWWACLSNRWRYVNLIAIGGSIPLVLLILQNLIEASSSTSGIIAFKLGQVKSLFDNPDFFALAAQFSSIGNLIAEGITLFSYLIDNIIFFILGKGFGGGIPDVFGFLSPFAGASGYAEHDALRNDFFNLHLAPYKILIDGGLIMFGYYAKVLWSLLSKKTAISFLTFLMLVMYFYVSKELLLLTYILTRICALSNKKDSIKSIRHHKDKLALNGCQFFNS